MSMKIDLTAALHREWYEKEEFIDSILVEMRDFKIGKEGVEFIGSSKIEREKKLVSVVAGGDEYNKRYDCKHFWMVFRLEYLKDLSNEEQLRIVKRVKTLANVRRRALKRKCNKERHGLLQKRLCDDTYLFPFGNDMKKGDCREFFGFVPVMQRKPVRDKDVVRCMENTQQVLVQRFRPCAEVGSNGGTLCAKKQSIGLSLAKTVVTGGSHACKEKGIAGTIHNNKYFNQRRQCPEAERPKVAWQRRACLLKRLERTTLDAITNMILQAFGNAIWFKTAMEKLKTVPETRLVKGNRIPCSHIWWTEKPEYYNVHTDNNTVGPAFLFTARTYQGGDLITYTSEGKITVPLERGWILGGLWAQYPHCITEAEIGRMSFVVYLDYRVLLTKYVEM